MKQLALVILMFIALPCFAEVEEYDGYKVGDEYKDSEGDIGIVVEVYKDGLRYDLGLYEEIEEARKERKESELLRQIKDLNESLEKLR